LKSAQAPRRGAADFSFAVLQGEKQRFDRIGALGLREFLDRRQPGLGIAYAKLLIRPPQHIFGWNDSDFRANWLRENPRENNLEMCHLGQFQVGQTIVNRRAKKVIRSSSPRAERRLAKLETPDFQVEAGAAVNCVAYCDVAGDKGEMMARLRRQAVAICGYGCGRA
jgi:hypothetical protein